MDGHVVFFRPEPKATAKKMRIWNIKRSKETLGMHICAKLPFVHAILGCDSTSRLYNIGKPLALKKLQSSRVFTTIAATFMQEDSSNEDIVQSGEVVPFSYMVEAKMNAWMPCATRGSKKKSPVAQTMSRPAVYHLLRRLQSSTALECTTKSRSGEDMRLTWTLNSGDGRTVLVSYCPSKPTCHLPQWSSTGCSDATARQAVTQAGAHVETMD